MLVPLAGLFIACAVFACISAAVLALIPKLRLTLINVVLFVIGAVPSSLVGGFVYGRVFADANNELSNPVALFGMYGVLLAAGLCGGLLTVLIYQWLMRFKGLQWDNGNTVGR
jgi:hypothetical protein